jgi:hypothetical protein
VLAIRKSGKYVKSPSFLSPPDTHWWIDLGDNKAASPARALAVHPRTSICYFFSFLDFNKRLNPISLDRFIYPILLCYLRSLVD